MPWIQQVWIDFWKYTTLYPIESVAYIVLVLAGFLPRFRRARLPDRLVRGVRWLGRRPVLSMSALLLLTIVGHLGLDAHRYPIPAFHDEYSYLLAADTFAAGRLTNPPHPMRYFFESFHINIEPTYMSMYPPGQGLALALGQIVGGHPAVGVWLSCGALAAAIYWMLRAWTPPGWALAGGVLAVVRVGWFSYWANSYWGGAMPALGGVLLLGAAGRLLRGNQRPAVGSWLGAGAVLLVLTRPWEGTILCATVLLWLLVDGVRSRRPAGLLNRAVLPAFLAVSFAGASFLALYNWSVTGSALRLPYLENRDRYEVYSSFVWVPPRPQRNYDHEVLRKYYVESEGYRDRIPYWQRQVEKPKRIWFFLIGPALTVPLLFSLALVCHRPYRLPVACLVSFAAAHLLVAWNLLPHYAAPITGAIYILLIAGIRGLYTWRRRSVVPGFVFSRATLFTVALMLVVRVAAPALHLPVYAEYTLPWYSFGLHANTYRAGIEQKLQEIGGKHLILVDYDPNHVPDFEWVYNRADIDAAPVVWARMSPRRDLLTQLLVYYRDRRVWVVYPDRNPGRLLTFEERIR